VPQTTIYIDRDPEQNLDELKLDDKDTFEKLEIQKRTRAMYKDIFKDEKSVRTVEFKFGDREGMHEEIKGIVYASLEKKLRKTKQTNL